MIEVGPARKPTHLLNYFPKISRYFDTASILQRQFDAVERGNAAIIVVNLSRLTTLDAAGIDLLLQIGDVCSGDGRLRVVQYQERRADGHDDNRGWRNNGVQCGLLNHFCCHGGCTPAKDSERPKECRTRWAATRKTRIERCQGQGRTRP